METGRPMLMKLEPLVRDLQNTLTFKTEDLLLYHAPAADLQSFIREDGQAEEVIYLTF